MSYNLSNITKSPFKDINYSIVTSDFGPRRFFNKVTNEWNENYHHGIDLTSGEIIVATSRGKVTGVRNNVEGYTETLSSGNCCILYHGNNVYTVYFHMKYKSVKVNIGDIVEEGQELGIKGSTGYSTGPHLHYGVKVNGNYVDPKPYLTGELELPSYGGSFTSNNLKTIEEIANEVIKGKWGNGKARFEALEKAGYNSDLVQNKVNEILKGGNQITTNTYVVKPGDNLTKIAKLYNTTWQTIYNKNKQIIGSNPNIIRPGQKLEI